MEANVEVAQYAPEVIKAGAEGMAGYRAVVPTARPDAVLGSAVPKVVTGAARTIGEAARVVAGEAPALLNVGTTYLAPGVEGTAVGVIGMLE
mmetsp:Transcript_95581/g.212611  ORF Transcript_95581/g.212611 Transcript_95581/m.212611 type:complete len:92 (+) Transcript_95581:1011-1286(+)